MSEIARQTLVVIAGPTAIGKTSLAITLARTFDSEIISADSRQFYKELNIGTAKPTIQELNEVKHHFINCLTIHDEYDAGQYSADFEALITKLYDHHELLFMVGGSGLYIDAAIKGFDKMPEAPASFRAELKAAHESGYFSSLLKELEQSDPDYYKMVDKQNPQRVLRALEVIRFTGQPYSLLRSGANREVRTDLNIIQVALEMPRQEIYDRIDRRMDDMISRGLFDEARRMYLYRDKQALQTVGYKEIFDHMDGLYDRDEAIRLLKRNSRRYAKRQLTWFRKDPGYIWMHPSRIDDIIDLIHSKMK